MSSDSLSSKPSPAELPTKTRPVPSESSPNKRPRTQNVDPSSPVNKGKSKLEEKIEQSCCGICLSDDGKAIRGWIDSCDHYFCYLCIMEWAKVETKCPMCKRRFTTIRRPPKPGLFHSERIVSAPVRDQVHHHYGNATLGPPDLYSEVQCSICDKATDESLLLLCDLCDSAAHTYCVGLGATVPEDEWFCQDCSVLMADHIKNEMTTDRDSTTGIKFCSPSTKLGVSILDIVRESSGTGVLRPTASTLRSSQFSSSSGPDRGNVSVHAVAESVSERARIAPYNVSELGESTLQLRLNVHDRIRVLRENWNYFRCGSLSFSSKPACGNVADRKHKPGDMLHGSSIKSNSSSCYHQPLIGQEDSSSNKLLHRCSHDIEKAWKMMEVAKSLNSSLGKTSVSQKPKHLRKKVIDSNRSDRMTSMLLSSNREHPSNMDIRSTEPEKQYQSYSPILDKDVRELWMYKKQKQSKVISRGVTNVCEVLPKSRSSGKTQTSQSVDTGVKINEKMSDIHMLESTSSALSVPDIPYFISSVGPKSVDLCKNNHKVECQASFSYNKAVSSSGNPRREKHFVISSVKKNCEARSEIQSLVKLNLKLLSNGKRLEVHEFKEIARLATHSVLAACGLEQIRPGVRSFPSSVCHHPDEVRQLRRSTLMPSSCRECFYIFVKEVVSCAMCEKIGHS